MSIDASAINEIFDMFPTDDPNPCEVLDELKQVKETLDEWKEADDYIDTPEELSNQLESYRDCIDAWDNAVDDIDNPDELSEQVESLRSDLHDSEERVEELEESAQLLEEKVEELQSPETHAQLMDDYVENYLDDQGIRKPFSDVVDDYIKLKDQFEAIEQSTEASAYNELIIKDLTKKVEELESELLDSRESFNLQDQSDNFYLHGVEYTDEETNEPLTLKDVWELRADAYKSHRKIEELEECKDITMDDLTTAEKEGDETLEEYVKRRIDKYILEGSLFTSDHMVEYEERMDEIKADRRELQEENIKYQISLGYVRHKLTESIQEAVPPS